MPTRNHTALKIRPESAPVVPQARTASLESILPKIEIERDRIFQAMSMIATVNKVLDHDGEVDDEADEHPLWYALRGVHGLLNDIAAELDFGVSLRAEVAHA